MIRQTRQTKRSAAVAAAFAGAFALLLTTGAPSATAADVYTPAEPEPGTDIPTAEVNFGMRPYADNTFYVIAMKKGWFADAGITIGPEELGLKVTDTNVNALLLNGQLDISSQYCPLMLPTYKSANTLKCIAFTDNFLGTALARQPGIGVEELQGLHRRGHGLRGGHHGRVGADEWQDPRGLAGAEQAAVRGSRLGVLGRDLGPRPDGRCQVARAGQGRPHRLRQS